LCNQAVGLIQRAIEAAGIPTVGVSILREVTEKVRPPRTLCLRYPFGHPFGEPFHAVQQRTILLDALRALETITEPGTILEPGYRWRRHRFDAPARLEAGQGNPRSP
jgi:D-proline reductase (dithiol) PrdB